MTRAERLGWTGAELGLAAAVGAIAVATELRLPYAILGGILAGVVVMRAARARGRFLEESILVRRTGLGLIGLTIGLSIPVVHLIHDAQWLPLYVGLALFMIVSSLFTGYLFAKRTEVDLFSGLLATLPGGLGVIATLAAEHGADVTAVATVQSLRMATVVIAASIFAGIAASGHAHGAPLWSGLPAVLSQTAALTLLALLALWAVLTFASRFKMATAPFFTAILLGIVFRPFLAIAHVPGAAAFALPPPLALVGQVMIGIGIGEALGVRPPLSASTFAVSVWTALLAVGIGLLAAVIARLVTGFGWLACILMAAPGGAAQIIAVALAYPHQLNAIAMAQVVRQLVVTLFMPGWIALFGFLGRKVVVR